MGQDKVAIWLHCVSSNALLEVLFKQGQMLVGQPVTQARALGEEWFLKGPGGAHVSSYIRTMMNCDAAEEATVVPISVQRQDAVLVAKPIRKTVDTKEQRLAIKDDFTINQLGLLVRPLGVGPSAGFKPQLFLLANPFLRHRKSFEPARNPDGLEETHRTPIFNIVAQPNNRAEIEHEAWFNIRHDHVIDLVGDGAFQISLEAKQECSPASLNLLILWKVV